MAMSCKGRIECRARAIIGETLTRANVARELAAEIVVKTARGQAR
jgi:hypothetical protein